MVAVYYRTKAAFLRNPLPSCKGLGSESLDKDDYVFVTTFGSEGTDERLGDVFRAMNVVDGDELPTKLNVRSMSVGDVIVDGDGDVWFCDIAGWVQTNW